MEDLGDTASKDESTAAAPGVLEESRHDDVESHTGSGDSDQDSSSDTDDEASQSRRQSPSTKNMTDAHGVMYMTVLPRHERRRIQLEAKRNKKPGNSVNS